MNLGVRDRLRLLMSFGAGSKAANEILSVSDPAGHMDRLLHDGRLDNDANISRLRSVREEHIDKVLDDCQRYGISVVSPEDEVFPEKLRFIEDMPILLFVLGDISRANDLPSVGIVGARNTDDYSLKIAGLFSERLSRERSANIVSGFARGIDTAAHEGALAAGGMTTAVLGCGLLHDYPKGTEPFKQRIAKGGAVVSEYLPWAVPARANFKVRNRILTGMCDCILVVNAGSRSGALNSACHAADQGREVFVIPPSDIFSERYAGQTALLNDGASLALSPDDIISYLDDLDTVMYK